MAFKHLVYAINAKMILAPEIETKMAEFHKLLERETDIVIEYISSPHLSLDHIYGKSVMEGGKQACEIHLNQ